MTVGAILDTGYSEIAIYGIIVLGNHYHIVCQGPSGHLAGFAKDMNAEVALRINRTLRRKGNLWGRRYDSQVTIEEADGLEALLYFSPPESSRTWLWRLLH